MEEWWGVCIPLRGYKTIGIRRGENQIKPSVQQQFETKLHCRMASSLSSWRLPLVFLVCVLVCLSSLAEAYPPKPEPPAGDVGPEEMAKYGKRSTPEDAVAELLFGEDQQDVRPR
ncbi:hypothetical protein DNTS_016031 [Danionella cerebrum]|uniref:Uncharacterized protein n=1 Tax=Danionella cerebrum TaxID=2873325 RepID=A0A553QZZ4_9TELE|nr:hypothetical protein DNTS_016031 [Danionella translucida]